jgi:hypothetical protein
MSRFLRRTSVRLRIQTEREAIIRREAHLKLFDENSSGRQCRVAAAAIYGSRPGSLLSAEPNRVAVLEVIAHVNSERDGD